MVREAREVGIGSRVTFNGHPTDESGPGDDYEDTVSLAGVPGEVVGQAPEGTGNTASDPLWAVRLPGGRVIHMWNEEMVAR